MSLSKQLYALVYLLILIVPFSNGQTSVFDSNCNQPNPVQFSNYPPIFGAGCVEMPNQTGGFQSFEIQGEIEIRVTNYIEWNPGMEVTPSSQGDGLLAHVFDFGMEVVSYHPNMNAIEKLDKLELGIKPNQDILESIQNFLNDTQGTKLNPFLSWDINVEAFFQFIPPTDGSELSTVNLSKTRHGFYISEVERDISSFENLYSDPLLETNDVYHGVDYSNLGGGWTVSQSEYPFRVRFAPPLVGDWSCFIRITLNGGSSILETPSFQFKVVESGNHGYLKVGQTKRWFKRDNATFVLNGPNYPVVVRNGYPLIARDGETKRLIYDPWYYQETAPIAAYEQYLRYMDTLAINGANYFRLIMNPWGLDIEYEKLGDYSNRLHIAHEMDLILERAKQNNMMIHWNLMIHYGFQTNPFRITAWDWSYDGIPGDPWSTSTNGNCYNGELGLNSPIDFFDNPQALAYYKERIRYIVARWGYSPTIGMFEHFSEINQIGTEHDENEAAIPGTNLYNSYENKQKIFHWHGMMSNYMKDELGVDQLLTLSYTLTETDPTGNITAGLDLENDPSFWHGNIDVISVNCYNYKTADIHDFYKFEIPTKVAHSQANSSEHFWGNYNKPLIFSESGAHEVWTCDNFIETRRNIWQNMFYGMAGAFDWEIENLSENTKDLSIYGRVKQFFENVDLDGGNWHPGITRLKSDGTLEFRQAYLNDCIREDELADLVYLRSGDEKKAFGVITNRRWNYFTMGGGECSDSTKLLPIHSNRNLLFGEADSILQTLGSVSPEGSSNRLRIRNMDLGEYKIKYYSPYDQVNSLDEETQWGPQLTLEFPNMDTLGIILFEVFRTNTNFKSMVQDSTEENSNNLADKKGSQDNILIYPNPSNGEFVIQINNPSMVKEIHIVDILGKPIHTLKKIKHENQFYLNHLPSGIYTVEIVYENENILRKIVIN
jgi:hypothetical protein